MIVSADLNKGRAIVNMKPNQNPLPNTDENQARVFQPDFVLVRKLVRGLSHDEDYTNALYGLMFANVPAVNTLQSVQQCLERPVVNAALARIHRKLGQKFPLIEQTYYSHQNAMLFTPEPPIVVKVGYAEAGYGKMRFDSSEHIRDFRSVLALHKDYVTAESYITNRAYDLRIQKIGKHYRAYKRSSSYWKGNVGSSILEEISMNDKFRLWADEAGKLFGGMDILTVDAIHTTDDKDYIIEINDTASGLAPTNEKEDLCHIRDLVLSKLNKIEKQKSG
eukprot:TRINITY_DN6149_c0_g1_i1.p1 TRINITY_DN6149_c0_g1~~TRINITY_DN6149_c0_g1_i1.p1  ORF type:complete len:278 (+),score=25.24 TRINITY_DN6149_c0_g1_i1:218-1051(+)